ncbi:hypothetical protein BU26DRAFT_522284 [Trematosphaeria pertusa]|uniref:Uncharacterized protein n=1 Tax=Trematosphaeria pertusa TaxID=390896 RepID=A0A6A6I4E9_9PLEO|nr:uncharacterized protein BU26DRAFT_522284 [Trematosphaeria pertusa]KAF2245177.1 hypothetical protein BU26DRAFT_522284 [Trematosphaeria pertusa]
MGCGCTYYWQTTKASGCKQTPPHTKQTKLQQDRCPNAPAGGQCANATEIAGSSIIITESGRVCDQCPSSTS